MSSLKTSTLDTRTKYHMITYVVLGIPLENMFMVVRKCGCVCAIMPSYVCIQSPLSLFSGQSHL